MSTSLSKLMDDLTQRARALGLTDSSWAAHAGMPKETLSRLRRRTSCDFISLAALAEAVGARVTIADAAVSESAEDMHFVRNVDRDYEERLVELCVSRLRGAEYWASFGPRFFMAGLAVMLASANGFDRRRLLDLAEELHPGASEPAVFGRWLEASPIKPSRFLPLVSARIAHAA